jgi:hypothetical protein
MRVIAMRGKRSRARPAPDARFATHSVVWPRLADGRFSPAMRKSSRSRLEASAALLLLGGVGPDVRPEPIVPPWPSA